MIDPITMGALLGLAKGELIDRPKAVNETRSRAITARFAPYRGEQSPSFANIKQGDSFQSALDFGLAGAGYKQQNQNANFQKQLLSGMLQNKQGNQRAVFQQAELPSTEYSPNINSVNNNNNANFRSSNYMDFNGWGVSQGIN